MCQKPLPKSNGAASGGGAAWWLGGSAPAEAAPGATTLQAFAQSPPSAAAPGNPPRTEMAQTAPHAPAPVDYVRREAPADKTFATSAPIPGEESSPWGSLALLLGLVAFGIAWIPRLGIFGVALGGIGVAIGLLGALLLRSRPGSSTSLAGACLSTLALIFASAVAFGYAWLYEAPASSPGTASDASKNTAQILEALKSADADERNRAVVAVDRMAGEVDEIVPALAARLLKSTDPDERNKTIAALARMAGGVSRVVPALTERLTDDDPRVRISAAEALGRLGPQARPAFTALVRAQHDDRSKAVREAAALAMEKINAPGLTTDELLKAFNSKDAEERNKAVAALAEMARGVSDAVPALTDRLMNDDDARIRAGYAAALGTVGPLARGSFFALLHVQKNDGDKGAQEAATAALDRIGQPTANDVPFLIQGLKDARKDYRESVAQALANVCTPENKSAVAILRDAVKADPSMVVKLFSALALWSINRRADEVMPTFREALRYRTVADVRASAAQALGHLGPEAALARPDLEEALRDEEVQVRLYAAQVLWSLERTRSTADKVVPVVAKILKAKNPAFRADAAETLAKIGPYAAAALDNLIEALRDQVNEPDLRARCAFALGSLGVDAAPAVRALAESVKTGGGYLGEQAAYALRRIGPRAVGAVPELIDALKDPNVRMRGLAALALAEIGDGARASLPALSSALTANKDPNIRVLIAQALWMVGKDSDQALPALLDVIHDGKLLTDIRVVGVNVLAIMGPAAKAALPSLLRLQEDPEETLRTAVAAAIEAIGPVTVEDRAALIKALDSTSLTHRKAAAETLTALREEGKDAVPALKRALADKDLGLRLAAAAALGAIGPEAKAAIPDLVEALTQPIVELRGAALDALRGIGPAAKDELLKVLAHVTDKDPRIRTSAIYAAVNLSERDPEVIKALEVLLKDEDAGLRVLVAEIHLQLRKKPDVVLPVLTKALNDSKPEVKTLASNVLGEIGPAAHNAIPRLTELSKDKNETETVRKAAAEALKKIGAAPKP